MCVQARIHSYTKAKSKKKSDLALSIRCHCQASAVPGSRPKNNCVFKGIFFSLINYIKKMYTETPSLLKKKYFFFGTVFSFILFVFGINLSWNIFSFSFESIPKPSPAEVAR